LPFFKAGQTKYFLSSQLANQQIIGFLPGLKIRKFFIYTSPLFANPQKVVVNPLIAKLPISSVNHLTTLLAEKKRHFDDRSSLCYIPVTFSGG
jgi:hypothetical protein